MKLASKSNSIRLTTSLLMLIIAVRVLFSHFNIFGISFSFYLILLLLPLLIQEKKMYRIRGNSSSLFFLLWIYIINILIVSLLNLRLFDSSIDVAVSLIKNIFIMIFAYELYLYYRLNDIKEIKKMLKWLENCVVFSSIFGILCWYKVPFALRLFEILLFGNNQLVDSSGRLMGLSSTTITFSVEVSLCICIVIWNLLNNVEKKPLMENVKLAILIYALILNKTRAAFIAAVIGCIFIVVKTDKSKVSKKFIIVFTVLSLIGLLFFYILPYIQRSSNASSQSRLYMFITGFNYFKDHIFGTGIYGDRQTYMTYSTSQAVRELVLDNDTHNRFLNTAIFYGIQGLIVYFLIIIKTIKECTCNQDIETKQYFTLSMALIIVVIINSFFHNTGFLENTDVVIMLIMMLPFCLNILEKDNNAV